jgi:UDP-glucose 4-epimerase
MSISRRNLLLAGAGGFVGPWLARAALADGWSVTGLSRHATANYGPCYNHVAADVTEITTCRRCIDRADAVIYNAAYIPANFADPAETEACLLVNAQCLLTMLGLLVDRPRPIVYISSAQAYQTTGRPASESDPVFPSGHAAFYLASKLLGDIYAEHYRLAHGMPASVLRVGSLYGPGQRRGMIAHFINQAQADRRITLKNGGRHQADLTFVGDVGSAAVEVLGCRAEGIINIGSGCATSALEAARLVVAAAGRSDGILEIEPETTAAFTGGFSALDITRAVRDLGFIPTPPAVGLGRTVKEWR